MYPKQMITEDYFHLETEFKIMFYEIFYLKSNNAKFISKPLNLIILFKFQRCFNLQFVNFNEDNFYEKLLIRKLKQLNFFFLKRTDLTISRLQLSHFQIVF